MPNLNTYADLEPTYVQDILEDSLFIAREQTLMPNLVTPFRSRGYAPRIVPIYPQLTAQTVAEDEDFSNGQEFAKSTEATFTPQEVMAQAYLTRQRLLTDPENAQAAASRELGAAIATKVDTDLTGLFDNFDDTVGTAGSVIALGRVAAAVSILRNNTKMGGKASVVLHPYQWHPIWIDLGQPTANQAFLGQTAEQALRDYFVGDFVNSTWYTTANISINASTDAYGAAFHREALGLDIREDPTLETEYDSSHRLWELNEHMGYAVAVHRSDYGVGILSDAAEPS